ncbi:MAG: flagellar brake protein [Candidatus Glassbacteria bacterium]|nr:flagellar brake protein [Candidatus Glassbacteria bacterium]
MDESLRDVLKYLQFKGPGPEEIRLFVISVVVYLVLIAATVLVHGYIHRRRERTALLRAAKQHGLTRGELALVTNITGKRSKVNPRKVFQSIREFHRLFGPLMHELVASSENDMNARRKLDGIFALRKKLFGDISYHFGSLTSTIQLKIGLKVTLQFETGDTSHSFSSLVLDVDSEAITVANPIYEGDHVLLEQGHPVKVSFNRPEDGYYEFETRALRAVSKESRYFLLLAHADKIQRMQSRMYFRVPSRIEVEINRFAWDEDPQNRYHGGKSDSGEKMSGLIVNLGGGGVLVRTAGDLHRNDLVTFSLPLTEETTLDDVLGKVVVVDKKDKESDTSDVHVQFLNLKQGDKDTIIKIIQQRKLTEPE